MTSYNVLDYSKTLTNLIVNGDFEGSGWSGGSYDTSKHHTGTRSYKLIGSSGSPEVLANCSNNINMINSHIYYIRWFVYHEGAPGTTGCYFGIAEPSFIEGQSIGPANQWNMISHINNRNSFSSGSQGIRFDYNNSNQSGTLWIDSALCIDLTDAFGSGNEPDKEWCDKNIPFFTGTTSILDSLPKLKNGDILDIPYSGSSIPISLKKGIYKLECWGAEGGGSRISGNSNAGKGGLGGYSVGTLTLNNDVTLFAFVGEYGKSSDSSRSAVAFNGGGCAWGSGSSEPANSGGGGSDFRINSDSLYARVIVAGGGGGGGEDSGDYGGYGGGISGGRSSGFSTLATATGTGTGGAFGSGANTAYDGGGGGGGWYGGGTNGGTQSIPSSNSGSDTSGGAGGSGYVYTQSTASQYPSGCLLDSEFYLTDAQTIAGSSSFASPSGSSETGHSGDGYCRITVIEVKTSAFNINVNGQWKESDIAYVNVNGQWKEIDSIYVNVNGVWKESV